MDKAQITRLSTCNYLIEHNNILLLGATRSGKTYLASALGLAAVRNFFSVKYVRLPELLTDLAIARLNGAYRKVVQQYTKPVLLIVDEWLLYSLKESEARDLLEIADARYKKASTILCSQFDVPRSNKASAMYWVSIYRMMTQHTMRLTLPSTKRD